VTRDTIRRFNRDTFWLAVGVLGTVIFAALVLAAREQQPNATQGGRDFLLNANPARVSSVIAIRSKSESEMSSESEDGVDYEFADNRLREIGSQQVEPTPSTPAAALASTPLELFRYRGAAKDGGTLEYVFEAGEQNSPNAVTKEKAAENQNDLGGKFPEVKDSIAALDIQDAIIDGEIVALDEKGRSSFQLLQGFDMGQEKPPIIYYEQTNLGWKA
jgi:hypothetical protein